MFFSFITHFITHLIDEVERNGDSDIVVREVKSPVSVFRRNNRDSSEYRKISYFQSKKNAQRKNRIKTVKGVIYDKTVRKSDE